MNAKSISTVYYSPTYTLQKQHLPEKEVVKLEEAVGIHGYRGNSKGKHNGVVNIKPTDIQLWFALNKYKQIEKNWLNFTKTDNQTFVIDVKVVAHCPSGNRIVGSLYIDERDEYSLYLFGFANYNYKIK